MGFNDYQYERPHYDTIKTQVNELIADLKNSEDQEKAFSAVKEINGIQSQVQTMNSIASIRYSIDTTDEFNIQEDQYWNEHGPLYQELMIAYYDAVLHSKFLDAFKEQLPGTFFKLAKNEIKGFDPSIIDLLQKENSLISKYDKLIASAQLEFDRKTLTLSQLTPYMESEDRQIRKSASETHTAFFEEHEAKIDSIFDELVRVRDQMAKKMGYKDFVELSYIRMNRLDYDRSMVQTYREQVLNDVVPVAAKLFQRQAKRIGVDQLAYYDLNFKFSGGNPVPQGDPDFIVEQGKKMYHELSPETGEFIDYMFDNDLVDLVSKKGKQSGGYCTYISNYRSPFIFSNFNGTSGDIDVLTHEAGHAFQVYQSRWIDTLECIFPTYESAEIHSMSMEFFTWPWMEQFFKEKTGKYKFSHLASSLQFLPYGVLVDHFQHEIYENPSMSPEERKAVWRKLEKMYCPNRNYDESPMLEKGTYWFRQGHIFSSPFYYIDYTLAQVCAFQFWKKVYIDHDETAWEDYLTICKIGGTQSFLEIVASANLVSPFQEGSLTNVIEAINDYLEAIPDSDL